MKYAIQLALLLTLVAGIAAAGTVVNFGSVDQPYNIRTAPYSVDDVAFSYEPDGAVLDPLNGGSLCGFDAGLGGLQGVPGCVGAQVDSSGVYGTTDGSLVLRFNNTPAFGLRFAFQLLAYNGLPPLDPDGVPLDHFGMTAAFLYQGNPVGFASADGSAPELVDPQLPWVLSAGALSFSTGGSFAPFDTAVINFSPTYGINAGTGQPDFGQTTFQMNDMSYDQVPEPASITLFGLGTLAIGASALLKRRQ